MKRSERARWGFEMREEAMVVLCVCVCVFIARCSRLLSANTKTYE